ncbi:MAG: carbamoyltransferase HypF [Thermodesulfobacteriota bacterium]
MARRAAITVAGIVQGVGFRPFLFQLARELGLSGLVANTPAGVRIEVEGEAVDAFLTRLASEAPPLARILALTCRELPLAGDTGFRILESDQDEPSPVVAHVPPDAGLCADCRRELYDPADRRYLYPFINCTNCGPRYTITRATPYDRANTTMAAFAMCAACEAEYRNPADRRFHAQPNACPACGPQLTFQPVTGGLVGAPAAPALARALDLLAAGGILGLKGLGGFHLAADATNPEAVARLRSRRRRSNKPFAIMVAGLRQAGAYGHLSPAAADLLASHRRPIVLVERRPVAAGLPALAPGVAPGNRYLGIMLPYTPVHDLLFHDPGAAAPRFAALVMTSGNPAEEPIVRDNDEAVERLAPLVDGLLTHDRPIFMRVDDSVLLDPGAGGPAFIRRARGWAPEPLVLAGDGPAVLAVGADLKSTFTLTQGAAAIVSQHLGDMGSLATWRFFEETLANLRSAYRVDPEAVAADLHPGYRSSAWASTWAKGHGRTLHTFQHHWAHIASVLAEHGEAGPVIGIALDGTGYGPDGTVWGGEILLASLARCQRLAHFRPLPLPGGEQAIRQPWRVAASLLWQAAGDEAWDLLARLGFCRRHGEETLRALARVAADRQLSPLSSGAGRLFEGVASLLDLCQVNTFEAEAAMALEAVAEAAGEPYPFVLVPGPPVVVDFASTVLSLVADRLAGVPVAAIAGRFHGTVAQAVVELATTAGRQQGCATAALSGGVFQNRLIRNSIRAGLTAAGFKVLANEKLPANDACISLGQAWLLRERLRRKGVAGAV